MRSRLTIFSSWGYNVVTRTDFGMPQGRSEIENIKEIMKMNTGKIVPIFYTCNDESISSTVTSLRSIIANRDTSYNYNVCILHNGLTKKNMKKMFDLGKGGINITLEDISAYTGSDDVKISFSSDFVRSFIPEMFPGYGKSILVKNDYVASEDISAFLEKREACSALFTVGC